QVSLIGSFKIRVQQILLTHDFVCGQISRPRFTNLGFALPGYNLLAQFVGAGQLVEKLGAREERIFEWRLLVEIDQVLQCKSLLMWLQTSEVQTIAFVALLLYMGSHAGARAGYERE